MIQSYRELTTSPRKALFDYSEQHVLFDTPSYFIDDVSNHYGNSIINSNNSEVCTNDKQLFFTSFLWLHFKIIYSHFSLYSVSILMTYLRSLKYTLMFQQLV